MQLLGTLAILGGLALGLALLGLLLSGSTPAQPRLFWLLAGSLARRARPAAAHWSGTRGVDAEIGLRSRPPHAGAVRRLARPRLARRRRRALARVPVLGRPVGLAEAIMLESLGQAVRSGGLPGPGRPRGAGGRHPGDGVSLGLAPRSVLAAALLKRARELVYGVPGLMAWASLEGLARDPAAELSST